MNTGYVKLHRSILTHWTFDDPEDFRAWVTLLLTVNYRTGSVRVGTDIVTVNPGEGVRTQRSWAYLLGWSVRRFRSFLSVLEKDGMVRVEIVGKAKQSATRIIIESWADYQDDVKRNGNANGTQAERERNANETRTKREALTEQEGKKGRREEDNPPNPPRGKFGTKEFSDALKKMGANESHVADFMAARKKKRAANTETALNRFVSQCEKASVPVADAVRIAAGRSWAGFYDTIAEEFHGEKGGRKTDVIPGV